MKKGLIIGIISAVVLAGACGFGSYEYVIHKNSTNITLNSKGSTSGTTKTSDKVVVPTALAKQGVIGSTSINNEKFGTVTVGSSANNNATLAIVPNTGTSLGISKEFSEATEGESQSISGNGATFNVIYNGKDGWSISYNGQSYSAAKRFTTDYIPKVIPTSATTGYLYAPASSATNQGFLIGYNLKNSKSVFNWYVTINDQSKSLPRLNALGLNNLMLDGDFGFYGNATGAIYLFNDTYTMTLQSVQYPNMKFIFNTGSKNNIEPLENMGYYNDSLTKSTKVNDNIPIICPVSSTTGYIYQKPTADACGYIWFFNTNWNKGYSLNANGIEIPAGNYNTPEYNANNNNVTVEASGNISGVTAVPATDFNGPYVNHKSATKENNDGKKSLEIDVTDGNGNDVAGQAFNIVNSSGTTVASDVTTNANGIAWVYNLPQDTYTITPVNGSGFKINETVVDGESAPVANLVYSNQSYNAPASNNTISGGITVNVPSYTNSVNIYQDGSLIQNVSVNDNNQAIFNSLPNGLYTVATVYNGYVDSAQVEVGLNSTNEDATATFYQVNQLTTGNIYAQSEDSNGNPLAGTTFELYQNGQPVQGISEETSGVNGTVEFSNIPFGNYTVQAVAGPNSGSSQSIALSNNNYTAWTYFQVGNN